MYNKDVNKVSSKQEVIDDKSDNRKPVLIDIQGVSSGFAKFLEEPNNKRIFFSGRFGVGKTYFLQQFFKNRGSDYDVYHLFPVRYQIASNENIIEILRYDILAELQKKHPKLLENVNDVGSTWTKNMRVFIRDKDNMKNLVGLIPKLGRPLSEGMGLIQKFKQSQAVLEAQTELGSINRFIDKMQKEDVHPLDHLIRKLIDKSKGKKASVLILDDFERIDPDHIFRILNVLSTHMEVDESNQFGFDHIVIVGDFKNIKSIFHHRYGRKAEFDGYFDKFYSSRPYDFDNSKATQEIVSELLTHMKYGGQQTAGSPALKNSIEGYSGIINVILSGLISQLLETHDINLRQLYKPTEYLFPSLEQDFAPDRFSAEYETSYQYLDRCLRLLVNIKGKDSLVKAFEAIQKAHKLPENKEVYYQDTISALCYYKVKHNLMTADKRDAQIKNAAALSASGLHELAYGMLAEYVQQHLK